MITINYICFEPINDNLEGTSFKIVKVPIAKCNIDTTKIAISDLVFKNLDWFTVADYYNYEGLFEDKQFLVGEKESPVTKDIFDFTFQLTGTHTNIGLYFNKDTISKIVSDGISPLLLQFFIDDANFGFNLNSEGKAIVFLNGDISDSKFFELTVNCLKSLKLTDENEGLRLYIEGLGDPSTLMDDCLAMGAPVTVYDKHLIYYEQLQGLHRIICSTKQFKDVIARSNIKVDDLKSLNKIAELLNLDSISVNFTELTPLKAGPISFDVPESKFSKFDVHMLKHNQDITPEFGSSTHKVYDKTIKRFTSQIGEVTVTGTAVPVTFVENKVLTKSLFQSNNKPLFHKTFERPVFLIANIDGPENPWQIDGENVNKSAIYNLLTDTFNNTSMLEDLHPIFLERNILVLFKALKFILNSDLCSFYSITGYIPIVSEGAKYLFRRNGFNVVFMDATKLTELLNTNILRSVL